MQNVDCRQMLREREALRLEVMRLRAEMMAAGLDPDPQQLALVGVPYACVALHLCCGCGLIELAGSVPSRHEGIICGEAFAL